MKTKLPLDVLPNPQFVAIPTFQEIFEECINKFKELDPTYAYFLAADPIVKVLRLWALEKQRHLALLNERALAESAIHAEGLDLDKIGIEWGVSRAIIQQADPNAEPPILEVLESDDRMRSRILDAQVAFSSAGPPAHYRYFAMLSDGRVKDAVVYSPDLPNFLNMGGRVAIAILSSEETGVPSLDLLATTRQFVNQKTVKCAGDIVEVEPAAIRPIDLVADIVLEKDAPPDILIKLESNLREQFALQQRLGWDAPKSWFTRLLAPEGVYEAIIVNPSTTPNVRPNQFPALNSVTIRFAGVAVSDDWDNDELQRDRLIRLVIERYIEFAVAAKRTRIQIQADLLLEMRAGIVQPSLENVAMYLGLPGIRREGKLIPADELAIMVHFTLSKYYERGFYLTR